MSLYRLFLLLQRSHSLYTSVSAGQGLASVAQIRERSLSYCCTVVLAPANHSLYTSISAGPGLEDTVSSDQGLALA